MAKFVDVALDFLAIMATVVGFLMIDFSLAVCVMPGVKIEPAFLVAGLVGVWLFFTGAGRVFNY